MGNKVITSNLSALSKQHQKAARKLPGALQKADEQVITEAIGLYHKTTRTWQHQPRFYSRKTARGFTINTDDQKFAWVDQGTKGPYPIPKNPKTDADKKPWLIFKYPYTPATRPRVIGSRKAGYGNFWARKRQVQHPGIKARNFTDEITNRMRKRWVTLRRKAIKDAINVEAVGL